MAIETDDDYITALTKQNESLMNELYNIKSKPRGRIGFIFLILGVFLFAFSIDYPDPVLSFLSLGILFLGGIFLYIRPTNFLREEIFLSVLQDNASLYNNLMDISEYNGRPHYFSPKTLTEINEVIILLPKNKMDELTYERIETNVISDYIRIYPPGLGLAKLIEKEAKISFTLLDIEKLSYILEKVLINDLELIKKFELIYNHPLVKIEVSDSLFNTKNLNNDVLTIDFDYLISAIVCAITMTINAPVIIEKIETKDYPIKIVELKILDSSSND